MALEVEGKMHVILPAREGDNARGHWTMQDFVITIPGQFERMAVFTVSNGRCNLNDFPIGEFVKVSFDINAREYQGRYYTTLNAWKMEKSSGVASGTSYPTAAPTAAPAPAASQAASAPAGPAEQPQGGNSDDLPF